MENFKEKFDAVFSEVLKLNPSKENLDTLVHNKCSKWDSLAQMIIIQRLEDEFNISFSIEEILEFNSYLKGLDLVKNKTDNDI